MFEALFKINGTEDYLLEIQQETSGSLKKISSSMTVYLVSVEKKPLHDLPVSGRWSWHPTYHKTYGSYSNGVSRIQHDNHEIMTSRKSYLRKNIFHAGGPLGYGEPTQVVDVLRADFKDNKVTVKMITYKDTSPKNEANTYEKEKEFEIIVNI